jgi:hypothetical protein
MERGLDREVCLTGIGAFTKSGEPGIGISQIGARVWELSSSELGCKIESRLLPGHHMHTYFLRSYPLDIIQRIENYRAKRPKQEQLPLEQSTQPASLSESLYMKRGREDRERAMPLFARVER